MWLDVVGWVGSALLVYSVMQARVLRFRVVNLAACLVLTGFNAALEIWPMVAMNVALSLINLWHVRALLATRHDENSYDVIEVGPDDDYLAHVLQVHRADVLRHQPGFVWDGADADARAFLVLRGDETVGLVLVHVENGDVAQILLDYVTPKYRDFSPGQFVFRSSGVLVRRGIRRVITPPGMVGAYYARIGFTARADGTYELNY